MITRKNCIVLKWGKIDKAKSVSLVVTNQYNEIMSCFATNNDPTKVVTAFESILCEVKNNSTRNG